MAEDAAVRKIWRVALPVTQTTPVLVPTHAEEMTFMELPFTISDWAGRGFAVDTEKEGADFHIRYFPNERRIGVTPLIVDAQRVLHLVLDDGSPGGRTLTLEFIPTTRPNAWQSVIFIDAEAERLKQERVAKAALDNKKRNQGARNITEDENNPTATENNEASLAIARENSRPASNYKASSKASQMGLARYIQMLYNLPEAKIPEVARLNPALQVVRYNYEANKFPKFNLTLRFAVRDAVTDSLGLAVVVSNQTNKDIQLDDQAWTIRAGSQVYPVGSSHGLVVGESAIRARSTKLIILVLTRAPDGSLTRLLPDQKFSVATVIADTEQQVVSIPISDTQ